MGEDRRRIVGASGLVAAAWIALSATPNAGSAARPTCERASGKTIVANDRVRAFARAERLFVCAAMSRRVFALGDYAPYGCDSSSGCSGVGEPVLAGRYVAYVEFEATRDAGTSAIYFLDTKRARVRRVWREGTLDSMEEVATVALVATRRGGVAWIALSGQTGVPGATARVYGANAGANPELLDEGQGLEIDPDSLALSDSERTLYWTHSGQPRSASIR